MKLTLKRGGQSVVCLPAEPAPAIPSDALLVYYSLVLRNLESTTQLTWCVSYVQGVPGC